MRKLYEILNSDNEVAEITRRIKVLEKYKKILVEHGFDHYESYKLLHDFYNEFKMKP